MKTNDYAKLLRKYHSAKMEAEAAKKKAEALAEQLKQAMQDDGTQEVQAGGFSAKVSIFETSRFNTTAFKKAEPATYAKYLTASTTTRLTVK